MRRRHVILISYAWRCEEEGCHAFGVGYKTPELAEGDAEAHYQNAHEQDET